MKTPCYFYEIFLGTRSNPTVVRNGVVFAQSYDEAKKLAFEDYAGVGYTPAGSEQIKLTIGAKKFWK